MLSLVSPPLEMVEVAPVLVPMVEAKVSAGAVVSMVTLSGDDAALVEPDTVSVAVKLWLPEAKVPVVVKLQAPLLLTVAVPSSVAPS